MRRRGIALFAALAVVLAACSSGGGSATSAPSAGSVAPSAAAPSELASASAAAELKPIRLQLQWFPQAQFAGYFAALDKGYYKDEGLDVTILPGAVEIVPATVVAGGQAEFGISWVPRMLAPARVGRGPGRHRPALPALAHAAGLLQGQEHHEARGPQGQEGRLVGLRQ